jgi:hypothetical protein
MSLSARLLSPALAILCVSAPAWSAPSPVEIVSSGDGGVVLRCRPGTVRLGSSAAGDGEYTDVWIADTGGTGVAGAPELPAISVCIAVPDCDDIGFSVVTEGTHLRDGVRVTPSPTTVPGGANEVSDYRFEEGDAYRARGYWPARAAELRGPSWIGTQRVAVIVFYPCQADPVNETLRVHDAIEVALSFAGTRIADRVSRDLPRREELLKEMLLNYDDGLAWRSRPPRWGERPRGDYFSTSANWLKLLVREQGIYRVAYSDLEAANIDASSIDPTTFRIFSGGGLSLPTSLSAPLPEWMTECTTQVQGEDDDHFDPGDAVAFYALGIDGWADEFGIADSMEPHHENEYANDNVYWLTWEYEGTPSGFAAPPVRMQVEAPAASEGAADIRDYWAREHYEQSVVEWQGFGDGWFWYDMMRTDAPEDHFFHEALDHVVTDSTGMLRGQLYGRSSTVGSGPGHHVLFYLNGAEAGVGDWSGYSRFEFETFGLPMVEGYNTYRVYLPREDPAHLKDDVVIDWFEFGYWRELWAVADQIHFGSSGHTGTLRYSLGGFSDQNVDVYRIHDKYTQSVIPGAVADSDRIVFADEVADTSSYVAVSNAGYLKPEIDPVSFEDLRTPDDSDYIMIAYDAFRPEAERLRIHRESAAGGSYRVRLVDVSAVYDEFSWGIVDPAAIRAFLRYTYGDADVPPTHVLLIGDTSLDFRQYLPSSARTFVPTFYTGGVEHFPTESWFVGFTGLYWYAPAMAIGRLSAKSSDELAAMIDKIRSYDASPELGPWRDTAIIVGDDEYKDAECCEFFHTTQAESIASKILPRPLDREKIYLMEYPRDMAGHKNAARNDLIDAWNSGAVLVNYTGHGSDLLMAHEYVFLFDDVVRLRNGGRLPLYFAASCRLNQFDKPNLDSLGEALVKSPPGGAIASIGSTRNSNAGSNSVLNGWFYSYVFGRQTEDTRAFVDIGSAFQAAFVEGSDWPNNTKFCILGDPATVLATPVGSGSLSGLGLEPMMRRSTVKLEGSNAGETEGLSGVAVLQVRDSADTTGYYHNYAEPRPPRHVIYTLPGAVVFDGPVSVGDGAFAGQFVVSSKARKGGHGRIRAYYYGSDADGAFSLEDVAVRDSVNVSDATGPSIDLGFEGGAISVLPGAPLAITIEDDNGVNLIARDPDDGITLKIDGGSTTVDLTRDFAYDLDSHRRGVISYVLPSLGKGGHTLALSASDNLGNRRTQSLSFEIISAADFRIRNVANYPNPFPEGGERGTYILFELPAAADVRIQIFTVGGHLIRVINGVDGQPGANQVYWDGLDQEGDDLANGVYLYRIAATSRSFAGDKAAEIGRAVIMR